MFSAKVRDSGQRNSNVITWDDGELSGPEWLIEFVHEMADVTQPIGPPGGPTWEGVAILEDALAVWMLLKQQFDFVDLVSGTVPWPPVTKGVVH